MNDLGALGFWHFNGLLDVVGLFSLFLEDEARFFYRPLV